MLRRCGGPNGPDPVNMNWFHTAEGEEEAGAELLRAAAEARFAAARAARAAGYGPLAERLLYRRSPEQSSGASRRDM